MFWLTVFLLAAFFVTLLFAAGRLRPAEPELAKSVLTGNLAFSALGAAVLACRLPVPYWVLLFCMAAVFGSCFGGQYLHLYYRSRVFDRGLHAFGTFSFALLGFYLLERFLKLGDSRLTFAVTAFLLGNTLGVLFELLEFSHDTKHPQQVKSQHGLHDTDTDMLFNLFGAAGAGALIFFFP